MADANVVNRLRDQAVTVLCDDTASVEDMRMADSKVQSKLTSDRARADYLVLMVRQCAASDQALTKMADVILPGSTTENASLLMMHALAIQLFHLQARRFPVEKENKRVCKLLSVALVHAHYASFLSLDDLAHNRLHLGPSTYVLIEFIEQMDRLDLYRRRDAILNRFVRIGHLWDAQVAIERKRCQAWLVHVDTLLMDHTPFPTVLVTLCTTYLL
jgi:hypothetical protein